MSTTNIFGRPDLTGGPLTGYVHQRVGYVERSDTGRQLDEELMTSTVINDLITKVDNLNSQITVNNTNVTLGGTTTVIDSTSTNIDSTTIQIGGTTAGGAGAANTKTIVESDKFEVGRYIYMNKNNSYTDSSMDSGLILNVMTTPVVPCQVNGVGFKSSTTNGGAPTVTVNLTTGYLPGAFLQVQGSLYNDGIYECQTHAGGVITIFGNGTLPTGEPYSFTDFVDEAPTQTITIAPITLSVIRGTSDKDSVEYGIGQNTTTINYHKMLYDTKTTGTLGSITLSDTTNQAVLGSATITAPGTVARTHTIMDTPNDEFTMNAANQYLENKSLDADTTIFMQQADNTITAKLELTGTPSSSTTIKTTSTAPQTLTLPDATDTLVARNTIDTLKNKIITDVSNNVSANALKTTAADVNVSDAGPPVAEQYLVASSGIAAGWATMHTVSGGSGTTLCTTRSLAASRPCRNLIDNTLQKKSIYFLH